MICIVAVSSFHSQQQHWKLPFSPHYLQDLVCGFDEDGKQMIARFSCGLHFSTYYRGRGLFRYRFCVCVCVCVFCKCEPNLPFETGPECLACLEFFCDYLLQAISPRRGSFRAPQTYCIKRDKMCPSLCCAQSSLIFAAPGTVAQQAPLSTEFPRQEYWSGQPFPSPENLPDSGIEPMSPVFTGKFLTAEPPGKPCILLSVP